MASEKDTFEPKTFAANTFACGTWRGTGVTVTTIGGPFKVDASDSYNAGSVAFDYYNAGSVASEESV